MNLDELKHIWQEQSASLEGYKLEAQELSSMLEGKSKTLLNKINRNIFIEMGVVVVLTFLGLLFLELQRPGVYLSEVLSAMGYVLISGVFFAIKYRNLNKGVLRTYTLKTALTHIVRVLHIFMQIYYWLSYSVPVFVFGAAFYGLKFRTEANGNSLSSLPVENWVGFILSMLLLGILSIFAMRLYVRWLYGKHYKELKACLAELEEQENAS